MLNHLENFSTLIVAELIGIAELGGPVMIILFSASLLLWSIAIERCIFFSYRISQLQRSALSHWWVRTDTQRWVSQAIRMRIVSVAKNQIMKGLSVIRVISLLTPLLGLLGTVTGMIAVFDVLAVSGAENARAMAAGVSRATVPTMAGMVVSLTAIFLLHLFQARGKRALLNLEHQLIDKG